MPFSCSCSICHNSLCLSRGSPVHHQNGTSPYPGGGFWNPGSAFRSASRDGYPGEPSSGDGKALAGSPPCTGSEAIGTQRDIQLNMTTVFHQAGGVHGKGKCGSLHDIMLRPSEMALSAVILPLSVPGYCDRHDGKRIERK